MKAKALNKSGRSLAVAAIAVLAPLAAAQADQAIPDCRDDPFFSSKLEASQPMYDCRMPGSTEVLKKPRGAEGPIRTEAIEPAKSFDRAEWEREQEEVNRFGATYTP